jgi:hypothetical protein
VLEFVEWLKRELPTEKVLSVAVFPPDCWVPNSLEEWKHEYVRKISLAADQLAVMAYNTSLPLAKAYQAAVSCWTETTIRLSQRAEIVIGLPAYPDEGGYHRADLENVRYAIPAVHAGLLRLGKVLERYQGIAVYGEWTIQQGEWAELRRSFLRRSR